MPEKTNDAKYLVKSLNKALTILDIISVREELTLAEICTLTRIDKSSAFKMLYTLERRGFVRKTANARYRLGEKVVLYNNRHSERKNIIEAAASHIRSLCMSTRETVTLSVLNSNGRTMNIFVEPGSSPNRVPSTVGLELDAYSVPMGKVLLAYSPRQIVQSILRDAPLRAYTASTVSSPAQLYKILEEVRAKGYCTDSNERFDGRSSIAAPIFDNHYECVAALALVCTTDTFTKKQDSFIKSVLQAAGMISAGMGYPSGPAIY